MDLKSGDTCENEVLAPEYRDRLRTWLEKMINSGSIPGLCWENKERTIFRMPWKHAGRQDYNLEEDSKIFMAWAIHSGRYREGVDKPEPIVWKTRLRCALNKMPDIRELPERSRLDISEPYRVYQLLPPVHKASQIRRRLYKRSQSQENDLLKPFGDTSKIMSLTQSSEKEVLCDWENSISAGRRRSSIEATYLNNIPKQQNSPRTSVVGSNVSPGLWLSTPGAVHVKPPISSSISNGIHIPQPLSIDPTNSLQSLTHPRYPLVHPLHNPFTNFSTSAISSFFPAPPGLDTLKRFSFVDPTLFTRQKYQEHLTNLARKLEENQFASLGKSSLHAVEPSVRKPSPNSLKPSSDEGVTNFHAVSKNLDHKPGMSPVDRSGPTSPTEFYSLKQQLSECQRKITSLERDLELSRTAHAQEVKARAQLEEERGSMKLMLERMGDHLRAIAARNNQPFEDETTAKDLSKDSIEEDNENVRIDDENQKSTRNEDSWKDNLSRTRSLVAGHQHSAFVSLQKFPKSPEDPRANKRSSSPLDLTVSSPCKKTRISTDEGDAHSAYPVKIIPDPLCETSSFTTSFPPGDHNGVATSPSSASSGSPDSVTIRSGEGGASFAGHSSSPLQRALASYPIQVT